MLITQIWSWYLDIKQRAPVVNLICTTLRTQLKPKILLQFPILVFVFYMPLFFLWWDKGVSRAFKLTFKKSNMHFFLKSQPWSYLKRKGKIRVFVWACPEEQKSFKLWIVCQRQSLPSIFFWWHWSNLKIAFMCQTNQHFQTWNRLNRKENQGEIKKVIFILVLLSPLNRERYWLNIIHFSCFSRYSTI